MADIKKHTDKIRKAIYGKEVRGALADGIEAINDEVEDNTEVAVNVEQRQDAIEQQFDDLQQNYTEDSPSDAEIVAARTNTKTKDRKSTRLNSRHVANSYVVFCLINKKVIYY